MARFAATLVLGLCLLATGFATAKSSASQPRAREASEPLLNKALDEIGKQRFDAALAHIDQLLRLQPNFRLAHLIRGDLLLAKVRPLTNVGNSSRGSEERVSDLREEAIARLRALRDRPTDDQIPRYLLQLPTDQKFVVVVDTGRSRLFVYQNDAKRPRLVNDYYISIGKRGADKVREGDQKTPVGVYHVTSSLPRKKLTDFYGSGAYPINYPNEWDKRMGRNGHGIWLHGTPSDTYSRPPRASDGCVVLANVDLDALADNLQIGKTQVLISEKIEWSTPDQLANERKEFLEVLERWRTDWESRDTGRYLAHYARQFKSMDQNLQAWSAHKKKVNEGKQWIKVKLGNVGVFRSPGKDDMVVVNFDQDYSSNNLNNAMRKTQYWIRENGNWRIVFEGSV
ncbi:MAG: L,D-transpeptidase family protein [Burkholderiales bacterium]